MSQEKGTRVIKSVYGTNKMTEDQRLMQDKIDQLYGVKAERDVVIAKLQVSLEALEKIANRLEWRIDQIEIQVNKLNTHSGVNNKTIAYGERIAWIIVTAITGTIIYTLGRG